MTRRRLVAIALVLLVLVAAAASLVALVALPGVAKRILIAQIRTATGRDASIETLSVDVWTGRVDVGGFRLADRAGTEPLATFERLQGRVRRRALLRGHLRLEDVVLTRPRVRVVRIAPRAFNISDLLDRPPRPGPPPAITVDRFRIVDGHATLEDRTLSPPRTWASERVTLEATNVSTVAGGGTATGHTVVEGAPAHLVVTDLRLYPVHLRAHLTLAAFDLTLGRFYMPGDAPVLVERGRVAAGATIVHDARDGTRVDAGARFTALALRRRGQPVPALEARELALTLNGLHVQAGQTTIGHVDVTGDADVTDAGLDPPARFSLVDIRAAADDVTWPPRRPGRISLAAALRGGGTLRVDGGVRVTPRHTNLRVRLAGVPFAPFAPYVPIDARIDGVAEGDLRVVAALRDRLDVSVGGSASVARLAVTDAAGAVAMSAERIAATGIDAHWPDRLTVGRLDVTRPRAALERGADGTLAIGDLFRRRETLGPPAPDAEAPRPPPAIAVTEVVVDDAQATFVDGAVAPPLRWAIQGVRVTARDVAWPPASAPVRVDAALSLPGGGTATARGTVRLDRRAARLAMTVTAAALAEAQPYLPFPARVRGAADAELDVGIVLDPLRIRARGRVAARDLAFADDTHDLLTIQTLEAGGIDVRWPGGIAVQTLRAHRPWAAIERDRTGRLSLRTIFTARRPVAVAGPADTGPTRDADARAGPAALEVSVADALFEEGTTTILDDAVEPPARFEVTRGRLHVRRLTWPGKTPARIEMSVATPGSGTLDARGTFVVEPPHVNLKVALQDVEIAPAQPYLPIRGRVRGRVEGAMQLDGDFAAMRIAAHGGAVLSRFIFGDADRTLLRFGRAALGGVEFAWPPARIVVGQADVSDPWVLIERDADGSFPLAALLGPRTAPTDTSPPASATRGGGPLVPVASATATGVTKEPGAGALTLEVGRLAVASGFGRFVDRTTEPDFAEELAGVSLTVEHFATSGPRPARFDFAARLGPQAAVKIAGLVRALSPPVFVDVAATLADYAVPRANPYAERFFGWVASQGRMSLDVKYRFEDGELQGANAVRIDGLQVAAAGNQHEVVQRIGLPLDLVVALLKDRNGVIDVNVPIAGRPTAPEFDFGEAMWGALRNLTIRLIALPFSVVGKLLFTEDSRIEALAVEPVRFVPGSAVPAPGMPEHLGRVATFLRETPAVRLVLRPVLTVADVAPLRRAETAARVQAAAGQATPAARREAATRLFRERFPGRAVPATLEATVDALAAEAPTPWRSVRQTAAARVAAVRAALAAAGVDAARLVDPTTPAAVEGEGEGRVEFEIVH